jgi:predicted PhzF superfamily epimerase YddE/YHI9
LVLYLVKHGLHRNDTQDMINLQGVAMGRPSRLHMRIAEKDGVITRVQVGGKSVKVGAGEIDLRR